MSGRTVHYLCLQPTREGQGSHAHVWGLVGGLRGLDWTVEVYEPQFGSRGATGAKAPGLVHGRELPEPTGLLGRLWPLVVVQIALIRRLRRDEAVYIRMHPMAVLTVWWTRLRWIGGRGGRVVVEVNGPDDDWIVAWPVLGRVRWLLRWMLRVVLRGADDVVVVTSGLGEWARTLTGRPDLRVSVVANGVDTDHFHPSAAGGPAGVPDRYAVFVGELAAWQGLEDLVGAFEHPAWPAGLNLVVAGDGAAAGLLDQARDHDDRRLIHLGVVPHDQVPGLLAGAAIALVTSRDRGGTGIAPIKLFEALACGIPVVASDVPDIPLHHTGPLVQPGDPAVWARAVALAIEQPPAAARPADHSWAARAAATEPLLAVELKARDHSTALPASPADKPLAEIADWGPPEDWSDWEE